MPIFPFPLKYFDKTFDAGLYITNKAFKRYIILSIFFLIIFKTRKKSNTKEFHVKRIIRQSNKRHCFGIWNQNLLLYLLTLTKRD